MEVYDLLFWWKMDNKETNEKFLKKPKDKSPMKKRNS